MESWAQNIVRFEGVDRSINRNISIFTPHTSFNVNYILLNNTKRNHIVNLQLADINFLVIFVFFFSLLVEYISPTVEQKKKNTNNQFHYIKRVMWIFFGIFIGLYNSSWQIAKFF